MDVQSTMNEEKAAFRFAGAFLAPAPLVFREIGRKRYTVQLQELIILKKFFGMSIQALLYRMHDLEIINKSLYTHACIQINKLGFKKREPEPMPAGGATLVEADCFKGLLRRPTDKGRCRAVDRGI